MCSCIKTIEENIRKNVLKEGKKVKTVQMQGTAYMLGSSETKTAQEVEVTLDTQKKPIIINILHSFCPFCGNGYLKEEMKKRKEVANG